MGRETPRGFRFAAQESQRGSVPSEVVAGLPQAMQESSMIEVWHKRKVVVVGQIALRHHDMERGMADALVKWANDERLFPAASDAWSTFDVHRTEMDRALLNGNQKLVPGAWKNLVEDVQASPRFQQRYPMLNLGFVFLLANHHKRDRLREVLMGHDLPGVSYRLTNVDPLTDEYDEESELPDLVVSVPRTTAYAMLLDDE